VQRRTGETKHAKSLENLDRDKILIGVFFLLFVPTADLKGAIWETYKTTI
jgi:hypothetical protein